MIHLDGTRLAAWLQRKHAVVTATLATPVGTEHAGRLRGYDVAITSLLGILTDFEIPPTPIDEIRPTAKTKVRRRDPDTSWVAATQQSPERSQRLYRAIYRYLIRLGPMTDDEIRSAMEARGFDYHAPESVTKRRGELRDAGWIIATPERRRSDNGGTMTVWAAVPDPTDTANTAHPSPPILES